MVLPTHGMRLDAEWVKVRYRLVGRRHNPVVPVLGGISADRRVDEWWVDLSGTGCALDPERYRLLSFDWHSCDDGRAVHSSDQALILARLFDELGIDRVETLVGASYGAMVGLAFAAQFPHRLGRLVAISGPHQSHPMSTARRLVQRDILRLAAECRTPDRGVALARALALTTYRPPELFEQRFAQTDAQARLDDLHGYLRHVGSSFACRFDLNRYLSLSESMDLHQVDPQKIGCETHLVAVDTDELVPESQLEQLAGEIHGRVRLHRLRSVYGHDAFLKEPEVFNRLIRCIVEGADCHALV